MEGSFIIKTLEGEILVRLTVLIKKRSYANIRNPLRSYKLMSSYHFMRSKAKALYREP